MILENIKAVITGVGDGIGKGIATAFCGKGAKISICDYNEVALLNTVRELNVLGHSVFYKVVDIRNEIEITQFVSEAFSAMQGINVLINNAAIMPVTSCENIQGSLIDDILSTNLKAPILFSRDVVQYMKKNNTGSIIHMSSVTGHNGFAQVSIYGSTKGALMSLARGQAMELAKYNIRVNTVSPGTVDSPMLHDYISKSTRNPDEVILDFNKIHPRGRIASIEEVANLFVFLASDDSLNITGTDIRCDGGYCIQGFQPT